MNPNGYDPDPECTRKVSGARHQRCLEEVDRLEAMASELYRAKALLEEALAVERMQFQAFREKVEAS